MNLRFIDLFAGIGGIRKGLELAAIEAGYTPICVFTSEIKPYALDVLKQNHPNEEIVGDITKVDGVLYYFISSILSRRLLNSVSICSSVKYILPNGCSNTTICLGRPLKVRFTL